MANPIEDAANAARRLLEATRDRDDAIRRASAQGESLRTIAAAAQLSHAGVAKILTRHP